MLKLQLAVMTLVMMLSSFAYGQTLQDVLHPAKKDVLCGLTAEISPLLEGPEFKESLKTIIGFGDEDKSIIMIYKSLENQSFSILETFAEGFSCIIIIGRLGEQS